MQIQVRTGIKEKIEGPLEDSEPAEPDSGADSSDEKSLDEIIDEYSR